MSTFGLTVLLLKETLPLVFVPDPTRLTLELSHGRTKGELRRARKTFLVTYLCQHGFVGSCISYPLS